MNEHTLLINPLRKTRGVKADLKRKLHAISHYDPRLGHKHLSTFCSGPEPLNRYDCIYGGKGSGMHLALGGTAHG